MNNSVRGVDIRNGTIRGRDVRNNKITGADVKGIRGVDVNDNSLTGADILEPSLATVPSAASVSGLRNSGQVKAADGGADVPSLSAGGGDEDHDFDQGQEANVNYSDGASDDIENSAFLAIGSKGSAIHGQSALLTTPMGFPGSPDCAGSVSVQGG